MPGNSLALGFLFRRAERILLKQERPYPHVAFFQYYSFCNRNFCKTFPYVLSATEMVAGS
jgi:hypothetical protein